MCAVNIKTEKRPLPVLTPRLALAASFVRQGALVADIGTDHALLPVYLVNSGICPHAAASDIKEGPLNSARTTARLYNAEEDIDFVLADGLDGIAASGADDIVIAGMGGGMIADIIARCGWIKNSEKRLILQPMTAQAELHTFLYDNGFEITREAVAYESRKDKYYLVACCKYDGKIRKAGAAEAIAGSLLHSCIANDCTYARAYIEKQARVLLKKARGLRSSQNGLEAEAQAAEQTARELISMCEGISGCRFDADTSDKTAEKMNNGGGAYNVDSKEHI